MYAIQYRCKGNVADKQFVSAALLSFYWADHPRDAKQFDNRRAAMSYIADLIAPRVQDHQAFHVVPVKKEDVR